MPSSSRQADWSSSLSYSADDLADQREKLLEQYLRSTAEEDALFAQCFPDLAGYCYFFSQKTLILVDDFIEVGNIIDKLPIFSSFVV